MNQKVSVIVPATREQSVVRETIQSLSYVLDDDNVEVLVIDNTPHASLKGVEQVFGDRLNIRWVHEPVAGLLSARHRGLLESRGDLLVYIDDDVTVGGTWLRSIVEAFEDSTVDMVGGRCLPQYAVEPPSWISSHFTTSIAEGWMCGWLSLIDQGDQAKVTEPDLIFGLNFAIRKRTLQSLGGFHPDCLPESVQYLQGDGETGLTRKFRERGLKAIYQPEAVVRHRIPDSRMTPIYFCKRAFYQGICDSFTQLREQYRQKASKFPLRLFREVMVRLRDFIRRAESTRSHEPEPNEVEDPDAFGNWLKNIVIRCAAAGRMFHLEAIRQQPRLIDWIKREDYWDYQLPNIILDASLIRTWSLERCNVPFRW